MAKKNIESSVFFEVWAPDHPKIPNKNWLQWLAVFTGFPNWTSKDALGNYHEQTWLNLLKKLIGWQDRKNPSVGRIIGNLVLGILILAPINILTVLIQTPISIVRVFTEFLPRLITTHIERKIKSLEEKVKGKKWHRHKAEYAGIISLALLAIPFHLLHFISRSFFTPIKSCKRSIDSGKRFGARLAKRLGIRESDKIAKAFAVIFAILSITSTVATWALAIPFMLQYIAPSVASFFAQYGMTASANTFFTGIKIGLSAIGQGVSFVLSQAPWFGQFVAALAATSPELIGISALAGFLTSTIGVPASNAVETFKHYWYSPPKEEAVNIGVIASPFNDLGASVSSTYEQLALKAPSFLFSPRSVTPKKEELKTVVVKAEKVELDSDREYSESMSFQETKDENHAWKPFI
jgi:hypothetical protein